MTCGHDGDMYQVTNVRLQNVHFESVTKHLEVNNAESRAFGANLTVRFDVPRAYRDL
jgi:hypothetical protein